jgi:hypothetical protein
LCLTAKDISLDTVHGNDEARRKKRDEPTGLSRHLAGGGFFGELETFTETAGNDEKEKFLVREIGIPVRMKNERL